ncbi:MAG: hypothetical protein QXW62_04225 [Candidatus Methanomethylicaceae archaeon]|nr:hypothetical protein [Candidatus Verstraetearchaeota archaeon]
MKIREIGIIAMFSSIYAIISLLPGFQVIGLPGLDIKITRSLESIYGIILGPFLGPLSAFIGAIIGRIIIGGGIGILFTPLAFISSFITGYITWKKNWKIPTIIFLIIIILWYIIIGIQIPYYAIPHIIGLIILPLFNNKIYNFLISNKKREIFIGLILISYSSTMAGHMLGNIIFTILINPSPMLFLTTLPLTIIERIIITLFSAILGTPIVIIIKKFFPIH